MGGGADLCIISVKQKQVVSSLTACANLRGLDHADRRRAIKLAVDGHWGKSLKTNGPVLCLATSAATLALAGCAVGPDFHAPAAPTVGQYLPAPLPAQTASAPGFGEAPQRFVMGKAVDSRWWTLFGSPTLDGLEDEALKHNADLAAAEAALAQAEAQYRASVLAAFQNTADVLQAIVYDAETLQHTARAAEASALAVCCRVSAS